MSSIKKSSKKVSVTTIVITSIVGFFLLRTFLSHRVTFIDKTLSLCATPVLVTYNKIISPLNALYKHYYNYKELIAERDFYKEKYVKVQGNLIEYQATYTFDKTTQKLENFTNRYKNTHAFLCKVLVHRLSDAEQIIVVNAGSRHGITKNMLAVYGSTLLGKVSETFGYYSYVQLITDKQSRVSVYCQETKTKGIIEGKNDKALLSLSYVDCLQPLKIDDVLISSGEGLIFPEGFGVGTIISYIPQELHYSVYVKPSHDISTIDYCYLIPYETCAYTPLLKNK